jgi:hypothetical protein
MKRTKAQRRKSASDYLQEIRDEADRIAGSAGLEIAWRQPQQTEQVALGTTWHMTTYYTEIRCGFRVLARLSTMKFDERAVLAWLLGYAAAETT